MNIYTRKRRTRLKNILKPKNGTYKYYEINLGGTLYFGPYKIEPGSSTVERSDIDRNELVMPYESLRKFHTLEEIDPSDVKDLTTYWFTVKSPYRIECTLIFFRDAGVFYWIHPDGVCQMPMINYDKVGLAMLS